MLATDLMFGSPRMVRVELGEFWVSVPISDPWPWQVGFAAIFVRSTWRSLVYRAAQDILDTQGSTVPRVPQGV